MKRKSRKFKKSNQKNGATAIAQKALNKAKKIEKMLDVEKKVHDVYDTATPSSAGTFISLTTIQQGLLETARVGDSIRGASLRWRFRMALNQTGTANQSIRIILFTDKQNNDPGVTNPTLNGKPYGLLFQGALQSLPLTENANRYKIFYDRTFELIDTFREIQNDTGYRTVSKKIQFEDENLAPAKVNNIWCFMLSNQATNPPSVGYHFRYKFVDN